MRKGLLEYEPSLLSLHSGHRVALVATIEVRDNTVGGGHLCKGLLSGQRFRLRAEVPPGTRKVTVLGGQIRSAFFNLWRHVQGWVPLGREHTMLDGPQWCTMTMFRSLPVT